MRKALHFLWEMKWFWMIPLILVLVLAVFIILTLDAATAPFIYRLY